MLFANGAAGAATLGLKLGQSGQFNAGAGTTLTISSAIDLNTKALTVTGSGTQSYSGIISGGAGSIVMSGAGTLTLSGTNTYTGNTTLNGGTISINSAASLGSGSGTVNFSATSTLSASASLNLTNAVTTTTGTAIFNNTPVANLTFEVSGLISGSGSVMRGSVANGSGAVRFSNDANSFTGSFSTGYGITEFTSVANAGAISSLGAGTGSYTLGNGGSAMVFRYVGSGDTTTNRALDWQGVGTTGILLLDASGAGTVQFLAASNLRSGTGGALTLTLQGTNTGNNTLAQVVNDNGGVTSVTKSSTGTWTLSGANTYTGATTISGGTLRLGAAGTGANTPLGTTAAGTSVASGAALDLNGFTLSTAEPLTLVGSGISNGGALTNSSATAATYSGPITLSGPVRIVASNGNIILSNPGMITGSVSLLTLDGAATGSSLASVIMTTGNTALTKVGTGTWTLSGANAYIGATTIQAGSLVAGTNSAVNTTGAFGNASTAIVLGNGSTGAIDAPALLINGAFTVARAISVGSLANTAAYNATIGGSNTTGTSTFTSNITLGTTAANYTTTLQAATGGTVEFKTGTWTTNNKAVAIGSAGNIGTVKLSNTLATTGGISVNFGTLQPTAANLFSSTTPITVAGGTFDIGANNQTAGAVTLSNGVISGSGGTLTGSGAAFDVRSGSASAILGGSVGLAKTTAGTVTLSAANTFTGATTVSNGTLEAAAAGALGLTSAIAINSGGTLLLSGANSGRVNSGAGITMGGGTLTRGSGPGEGTGSSTTDGGATISSGMTAQGFGTLTLSSNSTLNFGTSGVATLTFADFTPTVGTILNITNFTSNANGYDLMTSGVDGTDDRLIFLHDQSGNLNNFSFAGVGASQIVLNDGFEIVPVPEPSTVAVVFGLIGLVGWRERKRFSRERTVMSQLLAV